MLWSVFKIVLNYFLKHSLCEVSTKGKHLIGFRCQRLYAILIIWVNLIINFFLYGILGKMQGRAEGCCCFFAAVLHPEDWPCTTTTCNNISSPKIRGSSAYSEDYTACNIHLYMAIFKKKILTIQVYKKKAHINCLTVKQRGEKVIFWSRIHLKGANIGNVLSMLTCYISPEA